MSDLREFLGGKYHHEIVRGKGLIHQSFIFQAPWGEPETVVSVRQVGNY